MNFWNRVSILLEQKGINKKTLATEADFDPSNITKGINNNNVPSAETAVKIAKVLDVSVEYLVTGRSNKYDYLSVSETKQKYSSVIKDLYELSPEKQEIVFNLIRELKHLK